MMSPCSGTLRAFDLITANPTVEFIGPADRSCDRWAEEQGCEQRLGRLLGWRLARTHHAVDLDPAHSNWVAVPSIRGIGDKRDHRVGCRWIQAVSDRAATWLFQLGDSDRGDFNVAFQND